LLPTNQDFCLRPELRESSRNPGQRIELGHSPDGYRHDRCRAKGSRRHPYLQHVDYASDYRPTMVKTIPSRLAGGCCIGRDLSWYRHLLVINYLKLADRTNHYRGHVDRLAIVHYFWAKRLCGRLFTEETVLSDPSR